MTMTTRSVIEATLRHRAEESEREGRSVTLSPSLLLLLLDRIDALRAMTAEAE